MQSEQLLANFNRAAPAKQSAIEEFEQAVFVLPDDYKAFLRRSNGGEGFIGGSYLILWRVEQLRELNTAYQADEYAPGFFIFGSDGGGEAFAFDRRSNGSTIASLPFVGMDPQMARPVAPSFAMFITELAKR